MSIEGLHQELGFDAEPLDFEACRRRIGPLSTGFPQKLEYIRSFYFSAKVS